MLKQKWQKFFQRIISRRSHNPRNYLNKNVIIVIFQTAFVTFGKIQIKNSLSQKRTYDIFSYELCDYESGQQSPTKMIFQIMTPCIWPQIFDIKLFFTTFHPEVFLYQLWTNLSKPCGRHVYLLKANPTPVQVFLFATLREYVRYIKPKWIFSFQNICLSIIFNQSTRCYFN